jgi:hypothetical protein
MVLLWALWTRQKGESELTKLQCCQGCMKNSLWHSQGIARKVLKKLLADHWLATWILYDLIILHYYSSMCQLNGCNQQ